MTMKKKTKTISILPITCPKKENPLPTTCSMKGSLCFHHLTLKLEGIFVELCRYCAKSSILFRYISIYPSRNYYNWQWHLQSVSKAIPRFYLESTCNKYPWHYSKWWLHLIHRSHWRCLEGILYLCGWAYLFKRSRHPPCIQWWNMWSKMAVEINYYSKFIHVHATQVQVFPRPSEGSETLQILPDSSIQT